LGEAVGEAVVGDVHGAAGDVLDREVVEGDGQYTSSDTGLIYLRARTYDPATAQFLSSDPALPITRAPYTYANENPLNLSDPSGLSVLGTLESFGEGVLHAGVDVVAVGPYARANSLGYPEKSFHI
jgi:RHS repeat-associated protein